MAETSHTEMMSGNKCNAVF